MSKLILRVPLYHHHHHHIYNRITAAAATAPVVGKAALANNGKSYGVKNIVNKDNDNKANPDQLNRIANCLVEHIPKFFAEPHPFNLYVKDLIFIDNIRSIRVQGVSQYAMQIALLKLYHSVKYTSTKVQLLNLVKHPEESCLKIRWRVVTKPGLLRFMLTFYKFNSSEQWNDGLSTMHVNKEGKIYCHVCDNIDVETDDSEMKKVVKNRLVDRGLHL